jgi:hypothetical protein
MVVYVIILAVFIIVAGLFTNKLVIKYPKSKSILQIILGIAIIILVYFIWESVQKPIRFNKEKNAREDVTINKLKDIRTIQILYKDKYGKFTGSFDTLMHIQTTYKKVTDSLKNSLLTKDIDRLRYIPYTRDAEFVMGASEVTTGSKVKVKVFEVYALYDTLLKDLDKQLVINYIDEREKIVHFPGLKVGSLKEATNNTGNWE